MLAEHATKEDAPVVDHERVHGEQEGVFVGYCFSNR
jgi:hypothetical protein